MELRVLVCFRPPSLDGSDEPIRGETGATLSRTGLMRSAAKAEEFFAIGILGQRAAIFKMSITSSTISHRSIGALLAAKFYST